METRSLNGEQPADPRLGRMIAFDERSRDYPIRALYAPKAPRSYTWRVNTFLDQGQEGSCVGHAWAHELCARPVETIVDHDYAMTIYFHAQELDDWPGGAYAGASPRYDGTAVIAGAKAVSMAGHMTEYRWAFGLDDLVLALGYAGPAVLGVNWHEGMFRPDPDGRIRPSGVVSGGHAILAHRVVSPRPGRIGQIWLHNSWGPGWGLGGECWMTFDDMAQLLSEDGEACIPVGRKKVAV